MALYAFDGTGDRWDRNLANVSATSTVKNGRFPGERYLTNIVFFFKEYSQSNIKIDLKPEDEINYRYYFSGVGSSGIGVDTLFGGAFGVGTTIIAKRAFRKLEQNFKKGDYVIDIVGYSRGAASARVFAHRIFNRYKKLRDKDGNECIPRMQ